MKPQDTHRLSQVPGRVVLLRTGQAVGGVEHRVEHGVINQTVGLRVETLRSTGQKRAKRRR